MTLILNNLPFFSLCCNLDRPKIRQVAINIHILSVFKLTTLKLDLLRQGLRRVFFVVNNGFVCENDWMFVRSVCLQLNDEVLNCDCAAFFSFCCYYPWRAELSCSPRFWLAATYSLHCEHAFIAPRIIREKISRLTNRQIVVSLLFASSSFYALVFLCWILS